LKSLRLILPALLLVVVAGTAQAQQRQDKVDQYEITARISDAMRLLSSEPERSLSILELLNQQFPNRERILTRLGYVHQVLGNEGDAEFAYKRALEVNPRSLEAAKALGMMYYAKGRAAEGKRVFDAVVASNDYSMSAYKIVGGALRDLGRYEEALALFEDGRRQGRRNFVLTLEVAAMHRQLGRYTDAINEYLIYVDAQPRNYRFTRDKILETLQESGSQQDAVVGSLERRLRTGAGDRYVVLDVLSAYYLSQGLLEQSLDMALAADEEPNSDGTVLIMLADQIITSATTNPRVDKRRYLELGVRALDAFTRNHPRQAGTDRARYMLATIYVQFGSGDVPGVTSVERRAHLERAVAEYADLSRRYPNSEYAELAYLERGDVLLRKLKDPAQALEVYRNGAVNSRRMGETFASRIAEVYLGVSEYDSAKHYFDSMINSASPVLVQTGYYYTGLMLAFQGQTEAARDTLTFLAEEDPSSRYTNDAIEVAWVLEEALMFESASLNEYLAAMKAELIGDTINVMQQLGAVVARPVYEPLRPRALFWMGQVTYDTGDLHDALATFRRFLREYPDEDLRPDVQRRIGAVYEYGFGQHERALKEYETVLVEYPEYAFLDEVRKDVRRLRYIVKGEDYDP